MVSTASPCVARRPTAGTGANIPIPASKRSSLSCRARVRSAARSTAQPSRSRGLGLLRVGKAPLAVSSRVYAAAEDLDARHGQEDAAGRSSAVLYARQYEVSNQKYSIHVETIGETGDGSATGDRTVVVTTDIPGRLILHWGLESGDGGSWKLPSSRNWPENTIEYKRRALQTPFVEYSNGSVKQRISVPVTWEDASSTAGQSGYLNFVIKDEESGRWYDVHGGNFHIPIGVEGATRLESSDESGDERTAGLDGGEGRQVLLSLDEIAEVPQDLAGVWSYMKWEAAGCPNRSGEESDREYQNAIREIQMFLRQGTALDELRGVAMAGVGRYVDFVKEQAGKQFIDTHGVTGTKAAVVGVEEIKREMDDTDEQGAKGEDVIATTGATTTPPAPLPQVQQGDVYVGDGMGLRHRNPLDLIHRSGAPRLSEVHQKTPKPLEPLWKAAREEEECVWHRVYSLGSKSELLVSVWKEGEDEPYRVVLTTDTASDVVMHWGVRKGNGRDWKKPEAELLTETSELVPDGKAAETPFEGCTDEECHIEIGGSIVPLQRIEIHVPADTKLSALSFVLRSRDGSKWWKDGGSDFVAPLRQKTQKKGDDEGQAVAVETDELTQRIIDAEVKSGGWTLMHRFNMAADLLEDIVQGRYEPTEKAMATIYVWLRYSATRQLTWQRNYNTQPRILGAAQERLTHKISEVYSRLTGRSKEWARLCLTTVGRGGNAQAVRDEILNIMHRNKISEVKGTWMEEFHQKLHNNTTPDDVGICEAYLAFLRTNGDMGAYWGVLSDHGIDRERLESFDRAIVTLPEFFGDKKDALIRDFEHYLAILKATHSGADLQASASAASAFIPSSSKSYLGYVLGQQGSGNILPLMESAVECRTDINGMLGDHRETMYLDLALENVVRAAAERGAGSSGAGAAALMEPLLQNLALSTEDNEEICYCLKAWQELDGSIKRGGHASKDQALRGMAVVERIQRALADISDATVNSLQDISYVIGTACDCDDWAVQLFSEEVVRGGPAFAVSLVLAAVEGHLRRTADLSSWQVISPVSQITGKLVVVPDLHSVADAVYEEPTILLAARVSGEEEPPINSVGIISSDAPDVLSHLSVRCRNVKALFAACYEAEPLEQLAELNGRYVSISTTAAGAVTWEEVDASVASLSDSNGASLPKNLRVERPTWCKRYAVGINEFKDGVVGAKSKNLAGLRGLLPDWINLPASVALPFGSFEAALKGDKGAESELKKAVSDVNRGDLTGLERARDAIMSMNVPKGVVKELETEMKAAGIPTPLDDDEWFMALRSLKAVWASKYNERAYTSTKRVGLDYDSISMSVLVQQVVDAKYAFVIHTKNPINDDPDEIYVELVRGMGEAIVSGTVPGSALAFTARKDDLDNPKIALYPSKSLGMFVKDSSLIFRSDSNGEDLEGYAGAGLYDSVTTAVMTEETVDYSSDRVVADAEYARMIMSKVARVGAAIEDSLGSAQDVEGVIDSTDEVTVVQTRPQM